MGISVAVAKPKGAEKRNGPRRARWGAQSDEERERKSQKSPRSAFSLFLE